MNPMSCLVPTGEVRGMRFKTASAYWIKLEGAGKVGERCAETIVTLAARGIFYARLPTKGTAGGGAFLTEDVLVGKPAYEWTLNHIIQIDNPLDLFPMTLETIGAP